MLNRSTAGGRAAAAGSRHAPVDRTTATAGASRRSLLLLLGAALVLMLTGLDGTPLRGLYDDVNRALIARNLAQSGGWIAVDSTGEPVLTKPPLMYWTAASLYRLTGRADELPARLASVLGMLVLLLGTFHLGRRLQDTPTGLLAGLLLVTMHLFLAMARQPLIDTVMLAGFGLCLIAVAELLTAPATQRTRWWLLLAVGIAWTTMTKGPVLLPLLLLILVPQAFGSAPLRPSGRQWLAMLGAVLLPVVPWHVAMLIAAPQIKGIWLTELLGRFTGSSAYHDWTQKPWWFYGPDLANTAPWLFLWPAGVVWAWRRRRTDRLAPLLLWWSLGGLVFFTVASATKRSYYLLPLYPAFALLGAGFWRGYRDRELRPLFPAALGRLVWGLTGSVVAGLVLAAGMAVGLGRLAWPWGVAALASLLIGWIMLGSGRRGWNRLRRRPELPDAILAAAIVLLLYHAAIVPPWHAFLSGKPFLLAARSFIAAEESAAHPAAPAAPRPRIFACDIELEIAAFYLGVRPFNIAGADKLPDLVARGGGGWLITRVEHAAAVEGLTPALAQTLHSPLREESRTYGLYRLPQADAR